MKLPKSRRLTSKKDIGTLFESGKNIHAAPLLLKYIWAESTGPPVQVLFSVPKRKVKLAVNRNRIKRIMREAFRYEQGLLKDTVVANKTLQVAVICLVPYTPSHWDVKEAMARGLVKISMEEP